MAIEDRCPLSPRHSLVLSRRHEADFFALGDEELDDVVRLAEIRRAMSEGLGEDLTR